MAAAAGPETGFRRVAVLGTGLVGGSLGLAVRKYVKDACVVGWDKKDVLRHADAELFRGAKYALIREAGNSGDAHTAGANPGAAPGTHDPRVASFVALLESLGAQPLWLDAETHDWAAAIVSHLPQLISVALAAVAREETDETGLPLLLAGSGLRDLLRLAGSPYQIWRDIALTNTDNIAYALDQMAQAIEHLRMLLTSRELEHEFVAANELYKMLRELQ